MVRESSWVAGLLALALAGCASSNDEDALLDPVTSEPVKVTNAVSA